MSVFTKVWNERGTCRTGNEMPLFDISVVGNELATSVSSSIDDDDVVNLSTDRWWDTGFRLSNIDCDGKNGLSWFVIAVVFEGNWANWSCGGNILAASNRSVAVWFGFALE